MAKTIVITGASSGIGKEIAKNLAKRDYDFFITCNKNVDGLLDTKKYIESCGHFCKEIVCDNSKFETAKLIADEVHKSGRTIDVLINNAGISKVGLCQDLTEEEWNQIWNSNVTSVVALSGEAAKDMISKKDGKIVNITSVWGQHGASYESAYSASKGAVDSFTKAISKELAPSNISVNAISCGYIDTPMTAIYSKEDVEMIEEEIPFGRIGMPSDVANAVDMVLEGPAYMTGQIITVSGGWY